MMGACRGQSSCYDRAKQAVNTGGLPARERLLDRAAELTDDPDADAPGSTSPAAYAEAETGDAAAGIDRCLRRRCDTTDLGRDPRTGLGPARPAADAQR